MHPLTAKRAGNSLRFGSPASQGGSSGQGGGERVKVANRYCLLPLSSLFGRSGNPVTRKRNNLLQITQLEAMVT